MSDKYTEFAMNLIDRISDVAEAQHPEIKLHTKETKEADIEEPALICCESYYSLEDEIARLLKNFVINCKRK